MIPQPSLLNHRLILWAIAIGLLLLSACGSAPGTQQAQENTQTPGQTSTITATSESTPTEIIGPSFTNPVYTNDFPDPHVILAGDTYFAYSTSTSGSNIRVIQSKDLVTWEKPGDALPALPKWSVLNAGYTWAPGVIQIGDQYVMYFVARPKEINKQCIGVGVSANPAGPFIDNADHPFVCQQNIGGSIDPYPFRDDDGKLYLLWKNDGNCCGYDIWLWVQELNPDGLSLVGKPVQLIKMDQRWERPLIENPAMIKHGDIYFLFYSANKWESHEYAIGYAVCDTLVGPCNKPLSEPWFKFNPKVMGPGGESFFMDTKGNLWMAYHAWTGPNVGYPAGKRSLRIDLVTFDGDKPVTNGPTYTPQPLP